MDQKNSEHMKELLRLLKLNDLNVKIIKESFYTKPTYQNHILKEREMLEDELKSIPGGEEAMNKQRGYKVIYEGNKRNGSKGIKPKTLPQVPQKVIKPLPTPKALSILPTNKKYISNDLKKFL